MQRVNHGGHCCGINHIYDFIEGPTEARVREFDRLRGMCHSPILMEVVLTQSQTGRTAQGNLGRNYRARITPATPFACWHDVLIDRGFRLVTRFKNPNSGNYCNVYHSIGVNPNTEEERK